jgi:hypothetical protein
LYLGANNVGKEALKTGSNTIIDILNKEPEPPVGYIFKNRFIQAKDNLEEKIKKMTGSGLALKTKRNSKKPQSRGTRRKVNYIITEIMECLKSGFEFFLKRSIQTSVVNSHTVIYKLIAPIDILPKLQFNCSDHSDYYIGLNSERLILRIKLVKTDGSDTYRAKLNTVVCVNNLLHSMISCLSVSLNSKHVTLHETN